MANYLDLAGLTAYDAKLKQWFNAGIVDITDEAINALFVISVEGPADNEFWYTSVDGTVVTPYATDVFGANIVSNTYEDGKGIIKFDGPVTSIGDSAFRYCTRLTSVTIPNSVIIIGEFAFYGNMITYITFGNSVTSIGEYAFGANSEQKPTITCKAEIPPILGDYNLYDVEAIYVPAESVDAYKAANNWNSYTDKIQPIQ